jgi:hypothetical protein
MIHSKHISISLPKKVISIVELLAERSEISISTIYLVAVIHYLKSINFQPDDGATIVDVANKIKVAAEKIYDLNYDWQDGNPL